MAVPEFYSDKILYPAIAVLIGLSALFGVAIRPRLTLPSGGMVGKPAPTLSLPVVANAPAGTRMNVADLKGHPILLDFWASWCVPCAMEAPVIDRLSRRFEKNGLVVLGVNVSDTPAVIKQYALQKGLSYPMAFDAGNDVSERYGVRQLPSLVLIDKEGKVMAFLTGTVDEAELSDIVKTAM